MKLKRFGALGTSLALVLSLTAVPVHAVEFTDVPSDFWGYEDIMKMSNQGYAKGYEDGSFKPNGKMTAAETLLFCARATGVDANTQTQIAKDREEEMEEILPESMISWASKEMAVAVEAGVLSLTELAALSESGALAKTITRENICMYLVRAMQLEPLTRGLTNYSLTYKDRDSISAALQPYVYVLTNYGIVKGKETGNFDPQGAVTRAEMTTMLSRAQEFMKSSGIVTELSEYTSYDWVAGTIAAVTTAADNSVIITISSDVSGNRSFSLPATVKIYDDNMLTTSSALKTGQYVRLNLTSGGAVREARLSGTLTSYAGNVSSLEDGRLALLVGGTVRNLTIDRFTEVMVGKTVGDRSIIDEEAGYTTAICMVDEMGHLASVKFSGGTQLMEGLVESVSTVGNVTTLGVTGFNGVVYRYTVPAGIAVTVNGVLGSLSTSAVGKHVQVRVSNDTAEAASIAVDTVSNYIQGPVKRLGTVGTARAVYMTDIFTGKEVSFTVSSSAVITYDGEIKTLAQIESGWYATVVVSNNQIFQMEAYPGSVTVEGTLSSITYGAITQIQVTQEDDSIVTYDLDITDLPTINRNGKTSSVDQLRNGDSVKLTIRYNQVERIDSVPQTANLNGTISQIIQEIGSVRMVVRFADGSTTEYTISEGISVTQGGNSTNIYNLKAGQSVALVTNGDEVLSIDITASASSDIQLTGTVYTVTSSGSTRNMTLLIPTVSGGATTVTVDVRSANLMSITGQSLNLNSGFAVGDSVIVYGSYDGATFVATIVIRQ